MVILRVVGYDTPAYASFPRLRARLAALGLEPLTVRARACEANPGRRRTRGTTA